MNVPDQPLVSVCIPSYNRAERLRRAVETLLAGTYANLEIIVSDNASSDHTASVCEELARRSPRVRCFRQPSNQGPTKNFAFARSQATGKYFLWHGDDDYLAPDYIRRCVEELERDPSLVLVSGLAAYHPGDGVVTRYGNVIQCLGRSPTLRMLKYTWLVLDNSIFCGAYRREAVAHCTFPNSVPGDWAWMGEVLLTGRALVLPEVNVFREEADNTSQSVRRIVKVLGLPEWHARLPWLAIPLSLARHLAFDAASARDLHPAGRLWRWTLVFGVAMARQLAIMVGPRIPFAGRIRRLFSRPQRA